MVADGAGIGTCTNDLGWTVELSALRVIGAIVFLFVTAPVASHLIGRAAHRTRSPQWKGTIVDEWNGDS